MSLRTGVSHGAIRWTVGLAESEFFMCDNPLPRLTWIPTQRHIDINTHTFLIQICRSGWLSEMLLSASSFGSLLLTPSAVHLAATLVHTHTPGHTHPSTGVHCGPLSAQAGRSDSCPHSLVFPPFCKHPRWGQGRGGGRMVATAGPRKDLRVTLSARKMGDPGRGVGGL